MAYALEAVDGGTRLTESDRFALTRPLRPLFPAFRAVKRRRVREQFAALDTLLRGAPQLARERDEAAPGG